MMTKLSFSKPEALASKPWQRILWNVFGAVAGGLLLAFSLLLAYTQSVGQAAAHLLLHPSAFFWPALFLGLLAFTLGLAAHRLWIGYLLTALAALILTLVNHFKTLITSMPLELYELQLVSKLGAITELNSDSIRFSAATVFSLLLPLLWCAVLAVFARPMLTLKRKHTLLGAGSGLCLFLLCFVLGVNGLVYAPAGVPLDQRVPQGQVYDACSVPLGLWRSLLYRGDTPAIDVSDKDALEELMGSLSQGSQSPAVGESAPPAQTPSSQPTEALPPTEESPAVSESVPPSEEPSSGPEESLPPAEEVLAPVEHDDQPNVILILSESFFDVTTLPGVTFERDPIKEFHALQEQSVSGRFYSRTLGYGTCNIELELFTGINAALLEQGDDPLHWAPADNTVFGTVPALMRDEGYYTAFLHMFNDTIYNRTKLFSTMGFDEMFFSTDFARIDPDAPVGDEYYSYLNRKISGVYYGDRYMTDLIIDLYEQNGVDGPVFLYASSMENHTPYSAEKYARYDYPFTTEAAISDSARHTLNAYVQGSSVSSKALLELVEYFSAVDEPTILFFFGDHVPGLNTETSSVYKEIGMYSGSHTNSSPEMVAELYSSEYLIWANDPSLLPAAPGTRQDTSCAFFGLEILEAARIPLSRYWLLVDSMREQCLAYNRVYFVDSDGTPYWTPPETVNMEPFRQMSAILADAKKDRHLTDWIREIP